MSEERLGEARRLLAKLQPTDLPRGEILTASIYARRLGLPHDALRLLSPFVRPRKSVGHPTDPEKMEYAVTLSRLGLLEEAKGLLTNLDRRKLPEVDLYESFILISEWNYVSAIPLLECYLSSPKLTEAQRFLAELNLASCFVHTADWERAEQLLASLREAADERPGFKQARSNILDLSIQCALSQSQLARAEKLLHQAESESIEAEGESLALRKWRLVIEIRKSANADTRQQLEMFCDELEKSGKWELLRECQFYLAQATRNEDLFCKVYFGSSNIHYRQWLLSEAKGCFTVPDEYSMGAKGNDVEVIHVFKADPATSGDSLLWRLFQVLACESYRPMRITALHHIIYPNEIFNPSSSPVRVRQVIRRLRKFLKQERIPVGIEYSSHGYRLKLGPNTAIAIPKEVSAESRAAKKMGKLRLVMGDKMFAIHDASQTLGQSTRSVNRLLRQALDENLVQRIGTGPATRYYFR